MSADSSRRTVLSVRLDVDGASITRECWFTGEAFAVEHAGHTVTVPVDEVVDRMTHEIASATSSNDATVAAVVTCADQVFVYALAERRAGAWTDLRHALQPVTTTWDDVRSGVVIATVDLITAASSDSVTGEPKTDR